MDAALETIADAERPFEVGQPAMDVAGPLVFASPHSGRLYPPEMMAASSLDAMSIRRSEDAFVDELIWQGIDHGAAVIRARFARAYIDVNREPYELDPGMFEDELPAFARGRGPRVAAGLGAIARIVAEGQEIYDRKLTFAEAAERIERVHRPYHTALAGLIETARGRFGRAVLIDFHSMPSGAASTLDGRGCDLVLGDRFGGACAPAVSRRVEGLLKAMGYRVGRNVPYAGGYTTEHYGRPGMGVHALQIEIDRALYLDEASLDLKPGYAQVKADLGRMFAELAQTDWSRLG